MRRRPRLATAYRATADEPPSMLEQLYRDEFGRIVASLIRLLGDFDLAEESAQEAFTTAVEQWPREGMPQNPRAWIIGTARHKAIDRIRRQARFAQRRDELIRTDRGRGFNRTRLTLWRRRQCLTNVSG